MMAWNEGLARAEKISVRIMDYEIREIGWRIRRDSFKRVV